MMGEACPPPSNSGDAYCRVAGPAVDACDYRGTLSTTRWPSQDGLARQRARPHIQSSLCPCRYGRTCQSWSANYPHNHSQITAELYPDGGLGDHNYCRNPDRSEDTAWCYTTDPEQRWEDCDLPSCSQMGATVDGDPTLGGEGLPGAMTDQIGAFESWASYDTEPFYDSEPAFSPDDMHSYSHVYGGLGGIDTWLGIDEAAAFAADNCTGTCTGHVVEGCFACRDECDYRGTISTTKYGLTCQKWSDHSPHNHTHITPDTHPGTGLGDHNYCRNPDRSEGSAWCYTTDPSQRWEDCDIPAPDAEACAPEGESGAAPGDDEGDFVFPPSLFSPSPSPSPLPPPKPSPFPPPPTPPRPPSYPHKTFVETVEEVIEQMEEQAKEHPAEAGGAVTGVLVLSAALCCGLCYLCRRKGKQDRKMNELRVRERAFDAEIARSSTELADEKAMQCKASTESDNEGNGEPAT